MTILEIVANAAPITQKDRRTQISDLDSLTRKKAEDLIYRLGFTAKDIAMRIKTAPSTKLVAAKLFDMQISPIRLSTQDYEYIRNKHIERLKLDESFDIPQVRSDLLAGLTAPSEILQEYDIPHRHIRIILQELIEDYNEIAGKCSSMRAISRANKKSSKFKIVESDPQLKKFLESESISLSNSAEFLKDLRDKIEYKEPEMQKSFISRYANLVGGTICYPEDKIFSVVQFRLANKSYLELRDEKILQFESSIFYRPMSAHEEDVLELLRENYDGQILINDRKVLNGKELDFFLPELSLAIEVNPIFTHNSNLHRNNHNGWRHEDNYHFEKYLGCSRQGIELIQLQEYDLSKDRFEKFIKPMIKMKVNQRIKPQRLSARKTIFKEISASDAKEFLSSNHRDGYASSSRKFCLEYQNEIVAVATISRQSSRFNQVSNNFELVRLAFKSGLQIAGGTSKLVKNIFRVIPEIESLVTYSDNDYGSGDSYLKSGFEFKSETGPRLRYISTTDPSNDRYSWMIAKGFNFKNQSTVVGKDALAKGLEVDNVEEYIEKELTHRTDGDKGYNRMFTSGSKKWEISRNEVI